MLLALPFPYKRPEISASQLESLQRNHQSYITLHFNQRCASPLCSVTTWSAAPWGPVSNGPLFPNWVFQVLIGFTGATDLRRHCGIKHASLLFKITTCCICISLHIMYAFACGRLKLIQLLLFSLLKTK